MTLGKTPTSDCDAPRETSFVLCSFVCKIFDQRSRSGDAVRGTDWKEMSTKDVFEEIYESDVRSVNRNRQRSDTVGENGGGWR